MMVVEVVKIEYIIEYFLIFFLVFVGSFTNDYLNIIQLKTCKLSLTKIFLSTFTASLLTFSVSEFIQVYIGVRGLMTVSFITGLVGFQLLERLSTLDNLISLIKYIIELIPTHIRKK